MPCEVHSRSQRRFIMSKCDRCGKATKSQYVASGDLFPLPETYPEPLPELGAFCMGRIERYDVANWLARYEARRHLYGRRDAEPARLSQDSERTAMRDVGEDNG